jgi:hypothetical protein
MYDALPVNCIGWAHLEVEQGRKRRLKVPSEARRLCSGDDATLAMRPATVLAGTGSSAHVEDFDRAAVHELCTDLPFTR